MPKANCEQTDTQYEDVPEDIETDSKPPLYGDRHVVRSVLHVLALLRIPHELVLRAIGADSAETGECF